MVKSSFLILQLFFWEIITRGNIVSVFACLFVFCFLPNKPEMENLF